MATDDTFRAGIRSSAQRNAARPILREHTHDGRIVGDPLPIALGVGVDAQAVPLLEAALTGVTLPGEMLLAVAQVADTTWEMYFVLTTHHAARVALTPDRSEARIVACAWEHMRSGLLDVRLDSGETILLGPLQHPRDAHLLRSAMSNLALPEGSDGRQRFVEPDGVRTGRVALGRAQAD